MNVNLTIQDGVQLTGLQHRGIISGTLPANDYVVGNYGNQLEVTYSGWVFTVKTGMAVLNGSGCENPTQFNMTFPTPSGSGTAMVIAKINLSTNIASIEFKTGTTLTQNNLVANSTGVREYELYRFIHSQSAITSFVDKRIIFSENLGERMSSAENKINIINNNILADPFLLWTGDLASDNTTSLSTEVVKYNFIMPVATVPHLDRRSMQIIPTKYLWTNLGFPSLGNNNFSFVVDNKTLVFQFSPTGAANRTMRVYGDAGIACYEVWALGRKPNV